VTLLTIVRADVKGAWNAIRWAGTARRRVILLALLTVMIGPAVLTAGFSVGYGLAQQPMGAVGVLSGSFTALTMVGLILSLGSVLNAFFFDRSLLLLAVSPASEAGVFGSRLITASTPAAGVSVLLYAELAGYGAGKGVDAGYYLLASACVAMVVVGLVSFQVAMLSLALRLISLDQARDGVNLLSGLMGATVYLGWIASSGLNGGSILRGMGRSLGPNHELIWLPTSWPARALVALTAQDLVGAAEWTMAGLALTGLVTGLGWICYGQAFRAGIGVYGESGGIGFRHRHRRIVKLLAPGSDSSTTLRRKDLLTLTRDSRRIASVLPSAVVAMAYPLLLIRFRLVPPISGSVWIEVLGALFAPLLLSSVLALPAVGLEGRGILLLTLAGVRPWLVLKAKLAYAVPVVSAVGVMGSMVITLLTQSSFDRMLIGAGATLWLSAGLAAISVGAGAIAPDFEAPPAGRGVKIEASLIALAMQMAFILLSVVPLALVLASPYASLSLRLIADGVAAGLLVAAAALVAGTLVLGQRSLARRIDGRAGPLIT
jgi:Putative ATP-binding cassette